jgi:hypothetical protein
MIILQIPFWVVAYNLIEALKSTIIKNEYAKLFFENIYFSSSNSIKKTIDANEKKEVFKSRPPSISLKLQEFYGFLPWNGDHRFCGHDVRKA